MAKKDFKDLNTGNVYGAAAQAVNNKGRQMEASPEEKEARAEQMQTQGRKGCEAKRINMAFTPSNYQFIKVMAKASGHTMTEFTNMVIAAYQREHPEIMEQANAFLDTINSGAFSNLLEADNK